LRQAIIASTRRYPGWEQDLQRLVPGDFLARTPHAQLPHLQRYLRAMQIRAERASLQPAKDAEKARQLAPFADWEKWVPAAAREDFRWMLEEFRVSIFAQELGTAQPVSAQRLKALGGW
jgi:ATP-dependent helicase HrpA